MASGKTLKKNIERHEGAMVYVCMNTFGGGETRMQMRSFANLGRLTKCATPLPFLFMKPLLLIALLLTTNIRAQDGSFSGTVYDLDSGRMGVISGSVDIKPKESTYLSTLRRINAELAESNARLSAEIAANNQLYELREQTRLLRKIANQ